MKRDPKALQCSRHGWGTVYEGTAEQLIGAGVIDAEHLAAPAARSQRGERLMIDGRPVRVLRGRGRFKVYVDHTAREQAQADAERAAQRAAESARARLADLARDCDDYRRSALAALAMIEAGLRAGLPRDGYCLDATDAQRAADAVELAIEAVVSARVVFDAQARRALEQPLRAAIAQSDPALQRMLGGIRRAQGGLADAATSARPNHNPPTER